MTQAVETERNKATLERFMEAMSSTDAGIISNTIDEFYATDAVIYTPVLDITGPRAQKEVFARLLRAYPDLHIAVQDVLAEGDKVVVRDLVSGTHKGEYMGIPPSGKAVTYNEIFIMRFANGRIVEGWGVIDIFSQLRQLGAISV